jgi:hypothetical protein
VAYIIKVNPIPKNAILKIEHIRRVKRDRGYKPYILLSHSDKQRVREFARAKRTRRLGLGKLLLPEEEQEAGAVN